MVEDYYALATVKIHYGARVIHIINELPVVDRGNYIAKLYVAHAKITSRVAITK